MQMSSWLNMFRRGVAGQLDALARTLDAHTAMLQQLLQGQAQTMAAIDDLTKAVDAAVSEMQHAASTIQNHPTAGDDPQLAALATRLTNAVAALQAVDPADAVAESAGANPDTGASPSA